ncbi:MAG: ACP S-malonyltransferase, partial [Actinomycetota bacterium]
MGRPWAEHESWELVDEASEVAGRDVGALLCDADADELRDTRNAQLTTFVSSLMVLDAVQRLGIDANFAAGHSLGEYTALAATLASMPRRWTASRTIRLDTNVVSCAFRVSRSSSASA